jgi:hypothetical protein
MKNHFIFIKMIKGEGVGGRRRRRTREKVTSVGENVGKLELWWRYNNKAYSLYGKWYRNSSKIKCRITI